MNLLNILGTSSPTSTATIPHFEQGHDKDSTDLQIRALTYLFKRLRIAKLSPFLKPDLSLKYTDSKNADLTEKKLYFQKLDSLYNTERFIEILVQDHYRVTIDFAKNKFRSFCILSEYPSGKLTRPSSPTKNKTTNDDQFENGFPVLLDYKDRKVSGFRFIIMPLHNVTIKFLATTLMNSDLYIEHESMISLRDRFLKAVEIIKKLINDERHGNDYEKVFEITLDEKALIIRSYLTKLAFLIQVQRIYSEYIKQQLKIKISNDDSLLGPILPSSYKQFPQSPSKSRPSSPSKAPSTPTKTLKHAISIPNFASTTKTMNDFSISESPQRKLSPRKSISNLRPPISPSHSPTRTLKLKPSVSKLKLEELYNPVASPASPTKSPPTNFLKAKPTSSSTNSSTTLTSVDSEPPSTADTIDQALYYKCKQAVLTKIEKAKQEQPNLSIHP